MSFNLTHEGNVLYSTVHVYIAHALLSINVTNTWLWRFRYWELWA